MQTRKLSSDCFSLSELADFQEATYSIKTASRYLNLIQKPSLLDNPMRTCIQRRLDHKRGEGFL